MASHLPRVSLIWAQDNGGVIGRAGKLPWHLPADLAWFKRQTMGKPVLMGRKTFASIGRPLPGRKNIVLTRQALRIEGCAVVHSLEDALREASDAPELMVIGGAAVYALALPLARRLYVTHIHAAFPGDARIPPLARREWREIFREDHAPDPRNPHPYSFVIFERVG